MGERTETGLTEDHAASMLVSVIRQGLAKEFIERVCWGSDFFTFNANGTLAILDGDLLEGMFDGR